MSPGVGPVDPASARGKSLARQTSRRESQRAVTGIREFLERAEGSLLRAWLQNFDFDGTNRVRLKEFMDGMYQLDFPGDTAVLAQAFAGLDTDASGELSLEELDQGQARLWRGFVKWCAKKFSDPERMLATLIRSPSEASTWVGESPISPTPDPFIASHRKDSVQKVDQKIGLHEFCEGMSALGYTGDDLESIFMAIDIHKAGEIGLESFKWLETERRKQVAKDSTRQRGSLQSRILHSKCISQRKRDAVVREFKQFLRHKYGNCVRGWRRALSNGSLVLRYRDLLKACANVGWKGDVKTLWTALDRDESGTVAIEELDARSAEDLAHFHKFVMDAFGCASAAFRKLDIHNTKKVKMPEFCQALKRFGFPLPGRHLFQCLDFEGNRSITEEDFEILQSWKPPEYLAAAANPIAADEFKQHLLTKYPTYLVAWRHCLDRDESNRCNWDEFRQGAVRCGYIGDIAGVWRALDDDLSGYITLQEIDARASETLSNFKNWAETEFGSVRAAFCVFDADGSNELTFREFRRGLADYGLERDDVRELFTALDITGDDTLCMEEIKFLDDWDFKNDAADEPDDIVSSETATKTRLVAPELTEYETAGPGPAAYSLPTTIGASPMLPMVRFPGAYSFRNPGQRLAQPKDDFVLPSPFEYDPRRGVSRVAPAKPTWTFSKEARGAVDAQGPPSETPGPDQYLMPHKGAFSHVPHITCGTRSLLRQHPLFRGEPCPRGLPRVPGMPSYQPKR